MEDVLALYREPYDPDRPVVCFDEHPTGLTKEMRDPRPAEPGTVARKDYQYSPSGTKNPFLASEPLAGWRAVRVKDRRTTKDWVEFIQHLVDFHYPDAVRIRVVLDNLNTHKPAAFYEYFDPVESRRLLEKLEFHASPRKLAQHGGNRVQCAATAVSRSTHSERGDLLTERRRVEERAK
jgi:hypothetical protein